MHSADRAFIAETTAKMLLEVKAVLFSEGKPFIFTSGWASPVYIDCRKLIFYPRIRAQLVDFAVATLARDAGLQFVVRRAEIDFLRGARLDDELQITVEVAERKRASLMLKQEALRQGEPMARALVQAACVRCTDLRPAPLPPTLLARLPKRDDEHAMSTR